MPTIVTPRRRSIGIASPSSPRAVASTGPLADVACGQRPRSRRAGVVAEAKPQDHRPPRPVGLPHPAGDPVDERDQDRVELVRRPSPKPERRLRAERAPAGAGSHAPAVAVVGHGVEVLAGGPPEHLDHRGLRQRRDLPDGLGSRGCAASPRWPARRPTASRSGADGGTRPRGRARRPAARRASRPGSPSSRAPWSARPRRSPAARPGRGPRGAGAGRSPRASPRSAAGRRRP